MKGIPAMGDLKLNDYFFGVTPMFSKKRSSF